MAQSSLFDIGSGKSIFWAILLIVVSIIGRQEAAASVLEEIVVAVVAEGL